MQIHKKLGGLDDNASKLTGNTAYWARRMPRTFAKSGERFIEAQKQEQQKQAEIRVKAAFINKPLPETNEEAIARRNKQRVEVIHILASVKPLGVSEIITVICYLEDISREQLLGDRRSRRIVNARAAVAVLARFWGHSFSHIGRCIKRDHGTVMHHWNNYGDNFEAQHIVKRAARMLRFQMRNTK